jgi:uncharacterized protein (TIGR00251 family)
MDGLDTLDLARVGGGTRLRLRVRPRSKQNEILGIHGGALKIAVVAAPEKGRANRAVVRLLAATFDLAPSDVTVIAGMSSQDKTVVIPLPPEKIARKLA